MKVIIKTLIVLVLISCNSWKSKLKFSGTKNDARVNAILDFSSTNKLNQYSIFLVENHEETNDKYCFEIRKIEKIFPELTDSIGGYSALSFPTKYFEINNKLFLWKESQSMITMEIVDKMKKYKCIDSSYYKIKDYEEVLNTGDLKKEYFYFICKNNLSKYEKTKAIWVDKEEYPKIDCRATSTLNYNRE
jgi:hypothetical protein